MNRSLAVTASVLALVIIGGLAYLILSADRPVPTTPSTNTGVKPGSTDITYKNASGDTIHVDLPFPHAVVGKDFSVRGKARGPWFFEASFPVVLLDKDGKELAIGLGVPEPQGTEWMTNEFVPFKADLKVENQAYIGPATLILKKDNPSGLPENDASVSFPITVEY